MTEHEDKLSAEMLVSLAELDPPDDFAERVLVARKPGSETEAQIPRTGLNSVLSARGAAVIVALAALLILVLWRSAPGFPGVTGALAPSARETIRLAHRGVAVAEAGASLTWNIAADGSVRVVQEYGDIFYRVEPGGAFEVQTPSGIVQVQGTSFRVEVEMKGTSKQGVVGAVIGAAVAAAVVVTVYEGKVVFSETESGNTKRTQLSAGETLTRGVKESPAADTAEFAKAPAESATREELLARDQAQRDEIRRLTAKVDSLSAGNGVRHGGVVDGEELLSPSVETLRSWAKECRVRFDVPPPNWNGDEKIPPDLASSLGLSPAESGALSKAMASVQEAFALEVRELYIEATGNSESADELSAESMANEIRDKSQPGEESLIRARLAQERAGLAKPPVRLTGVSPLERYYRLLAQLGDAAENAAADVIGKERARSMRAKNGGWGMQMEMAGCADEDDPQ